MSVFLAVGTVAVYAGVMRNEFIAYDDPDYVTENAAVQQGLTWESIACFRRALSINPQSIEALNRLAWILATCGDGSLRNGPEAIHLAARACDLTRRQHPESLNALAAAYAEAGRCDEAVRTAQQAVTLAQASGQGSLAGAFQSLLQLYQAQKSYHEPAP